MTFNFSMVKFLTLGTWDMGLRVRVIMKWIILWHCIKEMLDMDGNILFIRVWVGPYNA